jgi:NADH:ubiquinone oxidoreductase subunit D
MELLIAEFLVGFPLVLSFVCECKCSIESSKGIYSIFLQSFPAMTVSMISNDYLCISQLNKFTRYVNLGDLVVLLGSLDFVLGSVDLL